MEKRYIVYVGQEEVGHIETVDIPVILVDEPSLNNCTIKYIFKRIIGIYKNLETVEKIVKENKTNTVYYYQEIDWEV